MTGAGGGLGRGVAIGFFLEPSLWIRSSQTSNCHSLIADWNLHLINLNKTTL